MLIFIHILVSFLVPSLFFQTIRKIAIKYNLIDIPGGRKKHKGNIPLIGGIYIFMGINVFLILSLNYLDPNIFLIVISTWIVFLSGLIDDLKQSTWHLRVSAQIFGSLFIVLFSGVQIQTIGNFPFFGSLDLGFLSIPFTILCVVALSNSINLMDGHDGLASTITIFPFLFALYSVRNNPEIYGFIILLIILLLSFKFLNLRKINKIFLGDSGSLSLGFLLSWILIYFSDSNLKIMSDETIPWLIALPIFDVLRVIQSRIKEKKLITSAGNDHIHHMIRNRYGKDNTLKIITLIVLSLSFLGLLFGLLIPELSYVLYIITFLSFIKATKILSN